MTTIENAEVIAGQKQGSLKRHALASAKFVGNVALMLLIILLLDVILFVAG